MVIGKFYKVEPKGSYLPVIDPSDKRTAATRISLSSLGVVPGDWIALEISGAFKAGQSFGDNNVSMIAVFQSSTQMFLRPAPSTRFVPVTSSPTYPSGIATDIDQDFSVPSGSQVLARVPAGAVSLLVMCNDSYFNDNSDPNNDYGVLVSLPNHPPSGAVSVAADIDFIESDYPDFSAEPFQPLQDVTELNLPDNEIISPEKLVGNSADRTVTEDFRLQYRGWFWSSGLRKHIWMPKLAHQDGRPSRLHKGIDLFWPVGSRITCPVTGIAQNRTMTGFGRTVLVQFYQNRRLYTILFAHLSRSLVHDGHISIGTEIGEAGCDGNAGAPEACGLPNNCGGRSDHVHIEVSHGAWTPNARRLQIVSEWRWNIRYEGSSTSLSCNQ